MDYSKKIVDEKLILSLFRKLHKIKVIRVVAGHVMADMLILDRKGDDIILENFEIAPLDVSMKVDVGFFYNDTFYSFATLITNKDSVYHIEKPGEVYITYKRELSRYQARDSDNIRLLIDGYDNYFEVKDLSIKGLAFKSNLNYEVGNTINNLEIILYEAQSIRFDAIVKHKKTDGNINTYGLYFIDIDWFSIRTIFLYILKNSYPNVNHLADYDKENIRSLFQAYLCKIPSDIANKRFDDMINLMDKNKTYPELAANLVYVNGENSLISTASALRIYNNTYLGHQLVAAPNSATNIRSRADIYYSLCYYLINNKYFKYYISYYVTQLTWHDLMFKSVERCINDRSKIRIDEIQFYTCNMLNNFDYLKSHDYIIEALNDPRDFLGYCNKNLSPLEVNAYCYGEDFYLEGIKQVYEAVGLYISRKLWCVKKDDRIVAYIVAESSSKGLNLFNLMDMARFIFVNGKEREKEDIIRAALGELNKYYKRYEKDNYNIVFDGEKVDLSIEGVNLNQAWARVITDRLGSIEYSKHIKLFL